MAAPLLVVRVHLAMAGIDLNDTVGKVEDICETVGALHVLDTGEPEYIPASNKELEWAEVAAGSAQATCSTICPAHDRSFTDVPIAAFWEEMLH